MLGNRNQLQNLNQENPNQTRNFPSKTPLRQNGPLKPGLTGGKGLGGGRPTTGRANRVLGDKDKNQGNGSTTASLLFTAPGKASASCNPNPTISTPLPSHLLLLPSHLRTPSPGVHRYASFNLSPGVEEDMEMDEIEPVQEDMSDRVVEGAGRSSWNYEEPYEPPFELPNFKTANYGKLLRAIPMHTNEDVWEEEDAVERAQVRAEIPMGINRIIILESEANHHSTTFPLPKRSAPSIYPTFPPRKPLVRSFTAPITKRPTSAASSSTSTRIRSTTEAVSKPKWGTNPTAPARKPLQSSLLATTPDIKPAPFVRSTFLSSSTNSRALPVLKEVKAPSPFVGSKEEELKLGIFGIVDELEMLDDRMAEESFEFEI